MKTMKSETVIMKVKYQDLRKAGTKVRVKILVDCQSIRIREKSWIQSMVKKNVASVQYSDQILIVKVSN